jgi:hypothetical protein
MRSESCPTSYLDKAIVRVAMLRARELIEQGCSADEAVSSACPGSWSEWRVVVRAHLESVDATS